MNPLEALVRGIGQFTGVIPGVNMPLNAGPIPMEGRDTRFLPNTDPYQRDYGMSRQVRQGMKNELIRQGIKQGAKNIATNPVTLGTAAVLTGLEASAPASAGRGELREAFERGDIELSPLEARQLYGGSSDMDAGLVGNQDALSQGAGVRMPGEGGGFFAASQVEPLVNQQMDQAPTSRAELEQRAYQNEATRLMQQSDPYFRAGGAPMMPQMGYRDPATEMMINQGLYGDQTTFSTPNPLMQGLNYNASTPVGQEQSQAQMMADRFRNGMIEAQGGANFGMNPSNELLSGMDPEMFRARLEAFEPGGPKRRRK